MKTYLIVDKNTMSRESITSLIYQIDEESVVHEAENLKNVDSISDYYWSIDTVIYNPGNRKENQLNNLRTLISLLKTPKILIITSNSEYDHIQDLLLAGACSVISITSGRNELTTAIRTVNIGRSYISHNLLPQSKKKIEEQNTEIHETTAKTNTPGLANKLTCRQKQVLDYIIKGYANKMIAYELGVSEGTVKLHVSSILRTLKVTNRTEAAMIAAQVLNSHEKAFSLNH